MGQVARLAKLDLSDDELIRLTDDLDSILGHIEELSGAEITDTEPMGGVSDHPAPYRPDENDPDDLRREPKEIAPDWQAGFFVVPRLEALDTDALEGDSR